jgi:uncharacterized membrane protein YbhN (UPF0104 family)
MKTLLQGLAGLALAAALLYWVFHDKDPKALGAALQRASLLGLIAGGAVNFAHNHFRVLRWRWLLDPVRAHTPYRPMFAAVVLGYFTTWLVPGRIGELVRPALLSARERIPLGPCLGTVVADRLLDGVAILVLFVVGSLTAVFAEGSAELAGKIRAMSIVMASVMVVGLGGLVAVGRLGGRTEAALARSAGFVRWAGHAILGLARGADALRSPRLVLPILAYSFLAWTTIAAGTWLGIRASGVPIGFPAVLVLMPMLALGVSIPTPGGAGGYHALMQLGLTQLFGVDPTAAAGAGLLMHLAIVIPVLAAGPALLYTEKLSLADLVTAAKQVKGLGEAQPAALPEHAR